MLFNNRVFLALPFHIAVDSVLGVLIAGGRGGGSVSLCLFRFRFRVVLSATVHVPPKKGRNVPPL